MPDRRTHRGPHPQDAELFAAVALPRLQAAAADLCWLLSRGYASVSSVKLVGDRYDLTVRQRIAVARCSCSDAQYQRRVGHQVAAESAAGRPLWLDGYNVLTTVEAALGGGVLLLARDGALRDMASMHGSYRKVTETRPALDLIARTVAAMGASPCHWYLDRPVSNSGRLKGIIEEMATAGGWSWQVELVQNPDPWLAESDQIIATADSVILDRCQTWFNLGREVVTQHVPEAWIVALPGGEAEQNFPMILVNNIAWALRRMPVFGVFGEGEYGLQPIYVDSPPAGATRLTEWIRQRADTLGRRYASELARRKDRTAAYRGS